MTPSPSRQKSGNPFSTRRVRPGAVPYQFPPEQSLAELWARFAASGWRGQITGRHGSGKSTLLAALVPLAEESGRRPIAMALHDGERRLPLDLENHSDPDDATLIIVDGYEQLGLCNRRQLKKLCRRRDWGLLVTAHKNVGLPLLYATHTDVKLAERIVEQLLAGQPSRISRRDVQRSYERCDGNVREMLFELYDLHERDRGPGL